MNPIFRLSLYAYLLATLASFIGYFYFAAKMWTGRIPSATLSQVLWNPFNICFRPALLTEKGLRARRYWLMCAGALFILMGAAGIFAFWKK